MRNFFMIALLLFVSLRCFAQTPQQDSAFIALNYEKQEHMIAMRDGAKLYTAVYLPKDQSVKHPLLMNRTPYSAGPSGKEFSKFYNTNFGMYAREKYIIVFQDVRGRFRSEGEFVDVRPFNPNKKGKETDEASDSYDTIDWLVKNISSCNGNVGVFGISYPGFYSTMAALSEHPALKAVSPQAPVTEWFLGDDFHHNGAFMLMDAFSFYSNFGVPRPLPVDTYNRGYEIREADLYKFYLKAGPLKNFSSRFLGDSIAFWNDLMKHPNYDSWWQARNVRSHVANIKPAMLTVGGTFDAEDCFGAWNLYKAIEAGNPNHYNKIVMGPWFHGAWGGRSTGENLGPVKFGSNTSKWYQDNIEFPFFQHFLNHKAQPKELAEATVFFSGENQWKEFKQWPPLPTKAQPIYLQSGGRLSFEAPGKQKNKSAFTQYTSDPANPVPFDGPDTIKTRSREYMTADQHFATQRKDVISFQTNKLSKDMTLAGPLYAELMVSITGTDADFVVKLIDVFPNNISGNKTNADSVYNNEDLMNGYQMMVRGEIMRGKFRNSFEHPEPFEPNKPTRVKFYLPDVAHTFLKGHRIMVQIQSSWFPLADRNPQKFVNIYEAGEADFQKAAIRIFHTEGASSKLVLPVLE